MDNWPLMAVPTVTDHLVLRYKEESPGVAFLYRGKRCVKGRKKDRREMRSIYFDILNILKIEFKYINR